MWPSAVILANYIIKNPRLIQNFSVLELGSGCGLTGLVAAAIGAQSVIQTDYNDAVLENLNGNILLNKEYFLNCDVSVSKLDFYLQRGESVCGGWYDYDEADTTNSSKVRKDPVSVVLAADVICKPSDSIAVSKTIFDCLVPGGKAYVLCANIKYRFGVDNFEEACRKIGLEVNRTVLQPDDDDTNGYSLLNCCSGFVKEMDFLLFDLTKPSIISK
jgi:predicted nicotinamide N-methyase